MATSTHPVPSAGAPLGPESLTWRYFGDFRILVFGFQRITATETAIPEISVALFEHSSFFGDAIGRGQRTFRPIMKAVYGPDPEDWGGQVRDFHTHVKGEMPDGSRYHALDPELFYWIHATFVDHLIYSTDMFIRRLSYEEKVQIFEESKTWFSRYGVSGRFQPATYEEFLVYWDAMLERSEATKVLRYGAGYLNKGIPAPGPIPRPIWRVISAPLNAFARLVMVGSIPEQVRTVLGLSWTPRQERRYQRVAAVIRRLNPVFNALPQRTLYWSAAIEARRRASHHDHQQIPAKRHDDH